MFLRFLKFNNFMRSYLLFLLIVFIFSAFSQKSYHFFEWVWFVSLCLMLLIRGFFSHINNRERSSIFNFGFVDKAIFIFQISTVVFFPFISINTHFFSDFDYAIPVYCSCVGAFFLIFFLILFLKSHLDLGLNWSPSLEIRKDHRLITKGVYFHMRHPMYSAFFLEAIGQALVVQNWIGGFMALPAIWLLIWNRVPQEEFMMIDRFGEKYKRYMLSTPRFIPGSLIFVKIFRRIVD